MNDTRCTTVEGRRRIDRHTALLAGLVAWVVGTTACSDSTGPEPPPPPPDVTCPGAQVRACDDATRSVALDGTADASRRSAPALENAAARTAVESSVDRLNTSLAAGNITKALAALADSRRAVEAARSQLGTFVGDAADLGAIELLLDHVASLIGGS
jgi:hypothetical protein